MRSGLGHGLTKTSGAGRTFTKDGLKLYMPYNSPKEVKFVGQGSTSFDGNNNNIRIASTTYDVDGSNFSFVFWAKKAQDSATESILGNTTTPYYQRIYFRGTNDGGDNSLRIESDTNADEAVLTPHTTDFNWHHYAIICTSGTVTAFQDGVALSVSGDVNSNNITFDTIGGAGTDGESINYKGQLKNIAIWNRVLSPTEIQNVMYKTYSDLSGTLSSGLVSWWALESSTDTYADSTGTNDGTNNGSTVNSSLYGGATPLIPRGVDNAPVVQADAIGTGYANFDDDAEYIDFGDVALGTSDFSISMWAYSDDWDKDTVGDTYILSRYLDGSNYWYIYTDGSKQLVFTAVVGGSTKINQTATFALTNGQWHHITIVADVSSDIKFYVDGVLVFSASDNSSGADLDDNASTLRLGTLIGTTSGFLGRVKNLGIWSGLLTQAQIQSIMEKTYSELTSSEKSTLVSWWGLDSAVGDHLKHVADEHGGVLGSEILKDPEFNVDVEEGGSEPNGWQLQSSGGTWNVSNGSLNCEGITSGENCIATNNTAIVAGKTYKIVIVVSDWVQGQVLPYVGDTVGTNTGNANGTYVQYITATSTTQPILKSQGTPTLKVNSYSVKEVSGNYGELK